MGVASHLHGTEYVLALCHSREDGKLLVYMRLIVTFLLLSLFLLGSFFIFEALPKSLKVTENIEREIIIGENKFIVDVADTSALQTKGLSGRKNLGENTGMLFIFDKPSMPGFWMKDMNFSIDIIWISRDGVAGFTENMQPDNSPNRRLYYPPTPVDSVLEVSAGTVLSHNIKIGDYVKR